MLCGISPRDFDQESLIEPWLIIFAVTGEKSNFQFILRLLNTNVRQNWNPKLHSSVY